MLELNYNLTGFADPAALMRKARAHWAPPRQVKPSAFVDGYRILTAESGAAEEGLYRIARTPYVAEPLDRFFSPLTRKLVVMANHQSGKTVGLLENIVFYCVHNDPCVIVHIGETKEKMLDYSKLTIDSMIQQNAGLKERFHAIKSRTSGNTLLTKKFIGGSYRLKGANTPTSFSQYSAHKMLLDEVDRWQADVGGDPIALAEGRIARMHGGKILILSTPTIAGISIIEREFAYGTQRHYTVPCTHCKHYQVLVFGPQSQFYKPTTALYAPPVIGGIAKGWLEFDKENCTWAAYHCEKCGKLIADKDRGRVIAAGRWQAYNPTPAEGVESYHFSELFTTINTSWTLLAQQFLIAQQNREKLRVFVNEKLGETFEDTETKAITAEALNIKRTDYYCATDGYTLPEEVVILVASCDVQIDRIELLLVGYGYRENHIEPYHILHKVFDGSPEHPHVWAALDEFLLTEFKHASGVHLPITITFIDCGAWTDKVLDYTSPRRDRRIYGIKGFDKGPLAGDLRQSSKHQYHFFVPVGKHRANEMLLQLLNDTVERKEDQPCIHFNYNMQPDYFEQLTNIRRDIILGKGTPKIEWRYRDRNQRREILHMWTYNLAALYYAKPSWAEIKENFRKAVEQVKSPAVQKDEGQKIAPANIRRRENFRL